MTIHRQGDDPKSARGHGRRGAVAGMTPADLLLASAALAYVLVIYIVVDPPYLPERGLCWTDWLYVSWVAADMAAALSLLTRRRWPLLFAITSVIARFVTGAVATLPIVFYTLISARRYVWAGIGAAAVCVAFVLDFRDQMRGYSYGSVPLTLVYAFEDIVLREMIPFVAVPVLLAVTVREHRQRIDNLRTLNGKLRRERELVAQNAALTERTRIAREMHDVVTHYVGLIVLRAGALELTAGRASPAGQDATVIADLGRRTMLELRDLLQVLRQDGMGEKVALSRAGEEPFDLDLATLLCSAHEAGMPVSWTLDDALAECPVPLKYAIYRIVQEALANAAKHAPRSTVHVAVGQEAGTLRLTVRNPVPPLAQPGSGQAGTGSGFGLIGMSERAEQLDGHVTAAVTSDGYFQVLATFPLRRTQASIA
ncbi:sensor histidine kinase [Streptomyces sp. MMS24-I31]|uniref:sensor histidine kinase n=1 Tax=Streptomyces sp. MMS24-I31 TaxID=3351563 RepID=UPI003896AB8C